MSSFSLRKIQEKDLEKIMHWRMDPDITRYMDTDPKLTLEGQKKWLASINSNPDVDYWMILVDGKEAGVINITGLMSHGTEELKHSITQSNTQHNTTQHNTTQHNTTQCDSVSNCAAHSCTVPDDGVVGWGYYVAEKELRSFQLAIFLELSLYHYVFDVLNKKALIDHVFSLNKGVIKLHLLCGSEILCEKKHAVEKNGVWYDVVYHIITKERWDEIKGSKKYTQISFVSE